MGRTNPPESKLVRCAIYTRKSTSAGLDLPINSLETQREVCRAYIKCQAHRNWVEVPQVYDDGGYSGGNLKRPALQRLIDDIEANRIDIVVIYKIDRLSRSLTDFVRLMDLLDRYDASFVSVTQTFDTSDSMGRLVLNILLTFAQFERELASERIRDRYEERRRKGLYCGGTPPIGYLITRGGRLVLDPERAETVRKLFRDFPTTCATALAQRLSAEGFTSKTYVSRTGRARGGQQFHATQILQLLRNPIYSGRCYRRGELAEAAVEPLVSIEEWELVQEILKTRMVPHRDPDRNFLIGILHDALGRRMRTMRGQGRATERCYTSQDLRTRSISPPRVTVSADRVERLVISAIQGLLTDTVKLKKTILSLGMYSSETARSLRNGKLAARRISLMQGRELRELVLALVPRAEVEATELRLLICTYELGRFLGWDGKGLFKRAQVRPKGADRFRFLYVPANMICKPPFYGIPVRPCEAQGTPQEGLTELIKQAADFKQLVLNSRSQTIAQIAQSQGVGVRHFSRVMRLNYLAPDIQAAIIDGTQPHDLTRHKLLFSSMPLDWDLQRHLLGFAAL